MRQAGRCHRARDLLSRCYGVAEMALSLTPRPAVAVRWAAPNWRIRSKLMEMSSGYPAGATKAALLNLENA
ncbi:hypothetical protein REMIM1_PE00503 (plasmid) [Rhizobium etli bv. mimosae str. Mim1]|nr:hypothetical protein REMIM1_PE00503 [Rhizobium etli bv. mimosae str. Mim1]